MIQFLVDLIQWIWTPSEGPRLSKKKQLAQHGRLEPPPPKIPNARRIDLDDLK